MIKTVADIVGAEIKMHHGATKQAPTVTGRYPYLETKDNQIFDSEAIAQHIARYNPQAGLNG